MTEPLPRYAEIRRALEAAILSGQWAPGHRVPSEAELVAQYGCSRMTVNKALSALAHAGLIVRRRRSGSFVAAPALQESVLEIHDIEAEMRAGGKPYRFDLVARAERQAGAADATRLGVQPKTPLVAVTCLHYSADEPLVVEERLINLATVPRARETDFSVKPPGSWLLAEIPWTEAEHRISAVNATPAIADALKLPRGAACLVVERKTWQGGQPLTWVMLTYPGDRHHLIARFRPSSGR